MGSLVGPLVQPLGGDPPNPTPKVYFDQLPGSDIAPLRNAATGKFDLQWDSTGNVLFDDTQAHAVLSLLYENKGQYWADATGQRGSYLYAVTQDRVATPSLMTGYADEALSLLVDQGKITPPRGSAKLLIQAQRVRPGRVDLNVTYSTPQAGVVTARATLKY